jgi:hypothetical protein
MTFLWSDAWLLQAIALASREGPATLAEVLAAADAVNHALPIDQELHGGFSRLTAARFVEEADQHFRLTSQVPPDTADALVTRGIQEGRATATAFLNTETWNDERNLTDPRNNVVYPGLTSERIKAADREYRQKVSRSIRG